MRSEWKEVKLADYATFQEGYVNPSQRESRYFGGRIKWLRAADINNSYVYDTERKLTEEGYLSAGSSAKMFEPETLVISKSGTIGRVGILKDYMAGNRATINIIPNDSIDCGFLFYLLLFKHPEIQHLAVGSVQRNLYISNLGTLRFELPSITRQRAIANTLQCMDDRIELNNKINENLEQQAQAIFKSWFVDFEPFQDGKFVESELGMIPDGWKIEKLGELIDVKYGKDHRALSDGDIPVYGSGGIMRYVDKSLYEKETVLIPRKGSLNNVTLINHPFWSVDTMFYTQMKMENFTKFLYQLLLMKDLASMNVGSAVPSMTVSLLNEIKFVLPPMSILAEFENITSAIYNLIWSNKKENLILSNIRDTLLPKLMSGEIEVPVE